MTPFTTYEPLQRYYLSQAIKYCKPTYTVLKTDLFNEAICQPDKGGILGNIEAKSKHGIEIVKSVVDSAIDEVPDAKLVQGDIRKLPYKDNIFDLILDFSTIDHVPEEDLDKVLGEYKRTLKNKGRIVLIVWVTNWSTRQYGTPTPNEYQFYFNKEKLEEKIKQYFTIESDLSVYETENVPKPSRDWIHQYNLI